MVAWIFLKRTNATQTRGRVGIIGRWNQGGGLIETSAQRQLLLQSRRDSAQTRVPMTKPTWYHPHRKTSAILLYVTSYVVKDFEGSEFMWSHTKPWNFDNGIRVWNWADGIGLIWLHSRPSSRRFWTILDVTYVCGLWRPISEDRDLLSPFNLWALVGEACCAQCPSLNCIKIKLFFFFFFQHYTIAILMKGSLATSLTEGYQ